MMTEIRWHGRAGQGVITSSRLLAHAALLEGKHAQAFPEFGPERLGAPVSGFTRISDQVIDIRSQIYSPDFVVVLDPTLMASVPVARGLGENGQLVLNSTESARQLAERLGLEAERIHIVDATGISMEIMGRPFVNTAMLGALIKIAPLARFESVEKAIGARFPEALAAKNVELVKRAWEAVDRA